MLCYLVITRQNPQVSHSAIGFKIGDLIAFCLYAPNVGFCLRGL